MTDFTDDALDETSTEKIADDSLAELATGLDPTAFNFRDWLDGLEPLTAHYAIPNGPTFKLQARSVSWLRENGLVLEDAKDDALAARILASHVVEPEGFTADDVQLLADTPGYFGYVAEMTTLAMNLDYRPSAISPRFLRGASD